MRVRVVKVGKGNAYILIDVTNYIHETSSLFLHLKSLTTIYRFSPLSILTPSYFFVTESE